MPSSSKTLPTRLRTIVSLASTHLQVVPSLPAERLPRRETCFSLQVYRAVWVDQDQRVDRETGERARSEVGEGSLGVGGEARLREAGWVWVI
jgi:hypothetical protein